MLTGKRILLIIGGGIAAYKSLDLIRRLKERGADVRVVMTEAAQRFVTPLAAGALSHGKVFAELFDREDEQDIGHIRLAREADLVLVAPATADLLAKMTHGLAGDLATAVLLATRAPILAAPAMNPAMWSHPTTVRNAVQLGADGVVFIGPNAGAMAERGEDGAGRMAEPVEIAEAVERLLGTSTPGPLAGRRVLVTSGPTHEPIDPVRYIANRSSGKQGHAIAAAAASAGAQVTLVSGPVGLPDPPGVAVRHVETAREMLAAVEAALPADAAIFAAAVADWRVAGEAAQKLKKDGTSVPPLALVENPDILSSVAHLSGNRRPRLVVGFAAETHNVIAHAQAKRARKGCDWIVANDVSMDGGAASGIPGGVMGADSNAVHLVTEAGVEHWPTGTKTEVARRLVARIAETLNAAEAAS
ncbi:bifunctional phosphopantothenoylcysteine decarboxylase/phosphopantothenate--cysteine ligase CoaBC [Bosea sp. 117]|uniref:bifunctional phosphopantothenoylcysteine decarboxylase/phosphopantothenate--cysteine ligase CoaBC n=1 Tax=Bosea sp. 117 TaxID=1125973 RepID=UPI00049449BC|nr:bifunctional phosphopantothenoylcysteine decarboxylase/phosphopantothenate--cysteine ligase CoaBC [Bosea sp. 117]